MKSPLRKLENELWQLCRKIVFKWFEKKSGGIDCYTCGAKNIEGQNRQLGHYFPKGALGARMKYDLRILRPQCYNCNINRGGYGGMFREKMKQEIGEKQEQELFLECQASKGKPVKASDHYTAIKREYESVFDI